MIGTHYQILHQEVPTNSYEMEDEISIHIKRRKEKNEDQNLKETKLKLLNIGTIERKKRKEETKKNLEIGNKSNVIDKNDANTNKVINDKIKDDIYDTKS